MKLETIYLMAGKRFQTRDVQELDDKLSVHGLITNLRPEGTGNMTIRRRHGRDAQGFARYEIVNSYGDAADRKGFDVCIGTRIGRIEQGVVHAELSDIARTLSEVKQDISTAELLVGSYWS